MGLALACQCSLVDSMCGVMVVVGPISLRFGGAGLTSFPIRVMDIVSQVCNRIIIVEPQESGFFR
uniref:Uncharacterized protein n=1 Tax=Arundo donax TaxID=35708 RepID=A0A0A9CT11_ARUDO